MKEEARGAVSAATGNPSAAVLAARNGVGAGHVLVREAGDPHLCLEQRAGRQQLFSIVTQALQMLLHRAHFLGQR